MSSGAKTILISINSSWNIWHFRASLVRALTQAGYVVNSAAPDDAYTSKLQTIVEHHVTLPMDNAGTSPLRDAALFFRYLRVLRTVKPAVLLTYTIKPNIYGTLAASLLGIPTIANVSGLGTAFIRNTWLTRLVKLLYSFAFRHAFCVFFQNPEDRDLFIATGIVAHEKAALLPGSGVDLDYFRPQQHASYDNTLRFVLIARMLKDKGVGEFVAAARAVRTLYPHAQFHLVGPMGSQNQTAITHREMDAWVKEGVVAYLGSTEDVRDVMAQHDCIVLPSYREGMSRVLLEAAAMGKPMIATDVAGCKHVVDHGKNGLLCNVRDVQSLAERMIQFIELSPQARAQMGKESRNKAEREFGEARVIEAYQRVIVAATL